jgi:hypothetical protein
VFGRSAFERKRIGESEMVIMQVLILKRASASRSSGEWNDDDFDVLANGTVEDRTPTHGYAARCEAAMAAFAKSWRRE